MDGPSPVELYRMLRLIRRFEERAVEFSRSGEIVGGIHPCFGQEAVAVGCATALRETDVVTGTHRGHGHALAKGLDPGRLLAELFGRETGTNRGRGGSMHPVDVGLGILGGTGTVGTSASLATGMAWAARRAGSDRVAMSVFGDGAVNEGSLLEALNLAALMRLPVVFVCENNGYSVTQAAHTMNAGEIVGRPAAFGIPASTVDGQDVQLVAAATATAVAYARVTGPIFLEFLTYRFDVHHTREFQMRADYRAAEEVESWRARDPVEIQGARIDPDRRVAVDGEVESMLDEAVRYAMASPVPDREGALDYLYASGLRPRMGVV